jgi:hypothetical protein
MYMEWPNRLWAASLELLLFLDFFETFSEHAPRNKLRGSTNFIIFGPTNQKFCVFENFRRSLGKTGMCWSQPARVDYIGPKKWAARIRNFEKSPSRISSAIF